MRGRINVPIKCKFSLGQNVLDSYTNRIFGFILSWSFYTPVSKDSFAFKRLVKKD